MKFEIVNNTDEAVLIEVDFANALDQMSTKGFSGREKYIKYTKGKNHTITLFDKDHNDYFSFSFGEGGYTLISDETSALQQKVYRFLLSQHIQPRKMSSSTETELEIFVKRGLEMKGEYCIHLGGEFALFLQTEKDILDLFGNYEIFDTNVAPTGVTVQKAKLRVGD